VTIGGDLEYGTAGRSARRCSDSPNETPTRSSSTCVPSNLDSTGISLLIRRSSARRPGDAPVLVTAAARHPAEIAGVADMFTIES
jgi:hypothetical protein